MIQVLGNSPERVVINDLGDVVYFRQKKEYTDQEFNNSKDLQRAISERRLLQIETHSVRSSLPETVGAEPLRQATSLNLNEIKRVVSDALTEQKQDVGNLVPMLISALRQEMAGMIVQRPGLIEPKKSYDEPIYVPEIKMNNLKSNINIESKQVEGNLSDSLEALKNLRKST
jgi:hypothetical protein